MKRLPAAVAIGAALLSPAWADSTINGLGAGAAVQSTDILPAYQGANPATGITAAQLKTFTGGGTVTSIATSCGVSGGTITNTGTIQGITTVNPQTGANYPIVSGDCGKLVNLSNASNQIPTIPSGATLGSGWFTEVCNQGAGTQTITPASGTIGGASTYVLAAGTAAAPKCVGLVSDGTNLQLDLTGIGGSASSGANPSATASDTAVNGAASTFMRSDGAPAVQKGTNAQFGLAEGDGTSISLAAGVAQRAALTGDVTASAGSSATTLAAGNAANLNSGTLNAARMPALTGDCTTSAGAVATTCPNFKSFTVYKTGFWYLGGSETAFTFASSSSVGSNSIGCYPGYLYGSGTIVALGARINTTSAAGNLGVAIYANNAATSRPTGTALISTVTLSTTSSGVVSTTSLSYSFTQTALVWFCSMFDNGTATANAIQGITLNLMGSTTQANIVSGLSTINGVTTPQTFVSGWPDLTSATFTEQVTTHNFVGVQIKF